MISLDWLKSWLLIVALAIPALYPINFLSLVILDLLNVEMVVLSLFLGSAVPVTIWFIYWGLVGELISKINKWRVNK